MKITDNPDWNGHINLKRYPVDHDRDNTRIVINRDTPKHVDMSLKYPLALTQI